MIGLGLSITQLAVRQLLGGSFNPLDLFANSEPGVWYDPSDMSTLFQDSSGATPVTAVEQPVGLMLDKSKGLVLGPELVVNGTFDSGTTGTTPATWQTNNANASLIKQADGTALFTSTSFAYASLKPDSYIPVTAGKFYRVSFTVTEWVAGLLLVHVGIGTNGNTIDGDGGYSYIFSATSTASVDFQIRPNGGGTGSFKIDNISVRELPGNHATQATATARSIYRAAPQRLVYDGIDDSHNTTFADSLGTNCTIARAVPGVGTSILTGQTVGTTFTNTTTHAGLIVINRALTAGETAKLTDYFNAKAGV